MTSGGACAVAGLFRFPLSSTPPHLFALRFRRPCSRAEDGLSGAPARRAAVHDNAARSWGVRRFLPLCQPLPPSHTLALRLRRRLPRVSSRLTGVFPRAPAAHDKSASSLSTACMSRTSSHSHPHRVALLSHRPRGRAYRHSKGAEPQRGSVHDNSRRSCGFSVPHALLSVAPACSAAGSFPPPRA